MFDFLVALAVGFIGLFVVYTLFLSISVSDNAPVVQLNKAKNAKKATKKAEKKQSKKAQKEEDDIIAAELRMANSGMQADVKKAQSTSLEQIKEKQKAKQAKQASMDPTANQTEFTARQAAREKEDGFVIVEKDDEPVAVKKIKKASKSASPSGPSQKELLDKKLGNFFRKNGKKGGSRRRDEDESRGAQAIVRKDIDGAGSNYWRKEE